MYPTRWFSVLVKDDSPLDEDLLREFPITDIESFTSKAEGMFPQLYPFLIPNSPLPQTFFRNREPDFSSDPTDDIQFDILSLNPMCLSASATYRRCIRCRNFSRPLANEPHPFLVDHLDHRCVCGGFFFLYTRFGTTDTSKEPNTNQKLS